MGIPVTSGLQRLLQPTKPTPDMVCARPVPPDQTLSKTLHHFCQVHDQGIHVTIAVPGPIASRVGAGAPGSAPEASAKSSDADVADWTADVNANEYAEEEKGRMTVERCADLILAGTAHRLPEVWISNQVGLEKRLLAACESMLSAHALERCASLIRARATHRLLKIVDLKSESIRMSFLLFCDTWRLVEWGSLTGVLTSGVGFGVLEHSAYFSRVENRPSRDGDEKKPVRFPLYFSQRRPPDTAESNLADSSCHGSGRQNKNEYIQDYQFR
jgi:hypothetical protein